MALYKYRIIINLQSSNYEENDYHGALYNNDIEIVILLNRFYCKWLKRRFQ